MNLGARSLAIVGSWALCAAGFAQTAPRLGIQVGGIDRKLSAALSRDGRFLLTGSVGAASAARLYDVETGRLIRSYVGNRGTIDSVGFSPNEKLCESTGDDESVRVWEVETGKPVWGYTSKQFIDEVAAAWSPDGRYLSVCFNSPDDASLGRHVIRVFDAQTGAIVAQLSAANAACPMAFSRDGRHFYFYTWIEGGTKDEIAEVSVPDFKRVGTFDLTAFPSTIVLSNDGQTIHAVIEPVENGKLVNKDEVFDLASHKEIKSVVTIGRDLYAVGSDIWSESDEDSTLTLRDGSGKVVGKYPWTNGLYHTALSANGRVFAVCEENTVVCYDVPTDRKISETRGLSLPVYGLSISPLRPDRLLVDGANFTSWDLTSGQVDVRLPRPAADLDSAAMSPDGRTIAVGGKGTAVELYDVASNSVVDRVTFNGLGCTALAYAPDGKWLAFTTLTEDGKTGTLEVVSLPDKKALAVMKTGLVESVLISSDGKYLAFRDVHKVRLIETSTWSEIALPDWAETGSGWLAFSPDGADLWGTVVTSMDDADIRSGKPFAHTTMIRYNLVSRKVTLKKVVGSKDVGTFTLTPDGKEIAIYNLYNGITLYNVSDLSLVKTLEDPPSALVPMLFSPDGKWLFSGALDGTVRVWNVATGKIVATFVAFTDGTWAAVDAKGRFDASNGGQVDGLYWLMGDRPVALSQFKQYFYDPHILAKTIGLDREPPLDVPDLSKVGLYPAVSVKLDNTAKRATVTLIDQGGGIGAAKLFVNGVNIGAQKPPPAGQKSETFIVDLTASRVAERLIPTKGDVRNRFDVVAYNRGGSLSSRYGQGVDLAGSLTAPPSNLFALVVGEDYADTTRALRYPGADATAFANGLELAAGALIGKDRVHITRLIGDPSQPGQTPPTKANILAAMNAIAARAKAVDVVIVYLSGHGVGRAHGVGGYYYVTAGAANADVETDPLSANFTLSSDELAKWLQTKVYAGKRAIILDTCAAGAATPDLTIPRAVPHDLELAWEQLKDNAGLYVLAGCAADRVSYEATNVGHGLLTYSLLEAIDQGKPDALGSHGFLDVDRWFGYAVTRVRELTDQLGIAGVQKPEERSQANASDYPVGLVNASVEGKLGLRLPGPVLTMDTFRNADNDDPLLLEPELNRQLAAQAGGKGAAPAYWPGVRGAKAAIQLRGSYTVNGGAAKITVRLQRLTGPDARPETIDEFEVEGPANDVPGLVQKIIAGVDGRIDADWKRARE